MGSRPLVSLGILLAFGGLILTVIGAGVFFLVEYIFPCDPSCPSLSGALLFVAPFFALGVALLVGGLAIAFKG